MILIGSEANKPLSACLGKIETHFNKSGTRLCTNFEHIGTYVCKIPLWTFQIISSNIPEALMLYPCFKRIQKATEESKIMIGKEAYKQRRR